MKCKYCPNPVTPDSRLAYLGVCTECAAVDEEGNRLQVEMGKGHLNTERCIASLSDCHTIAEVFRLMADEAENSVTYSGLVLKNNSEEIQDLALSYLQKTILFEKKRRSKNKTEELMSKKEKLLTEIKELINQLSSGPSAKECLEECARRGVTIRHLMEAGFFDKYFDNCVETT